MAAKFAAEPGAFDELFRRIDAMWAAWVRDKARTDYTMLLGSLFLLRVGGGPLSVDGRLVGAGKSDDA